MASKPSNINNLEKAVREIGTPDSPEAAAKLVMAATEATESVRAWMVAESRVRSRSVAPREVAAAGRLGFYEGLAALGRQLLALQFQVADLTASVPERPDALASLRYLTARRVFESDAEMADTLGVHRSQISRWKQGAAPDPANAEKLIGLDVVVSLLEGFLETESIRKWLRGVNAHLGNRRPIDVLRENRLSDVIRAIEAEKTGAFA